MMMSIMISAIFAGIAGFLVGTIFFNNEAKRFKVRTSLTAMKDALHRLFYGDGEDKMTRFYRRLGEDMAEAWRRTGRDLAQAMLTCSVRDQERVTDEKTRATLKDIENNMRVFLDESRKASRASRGWF